MSIFRDLLYGQVWEDERLMASFFATETSDPTYLCIASAGEFVTHLALQGARVVAVDSSKAQLALSALKWESRCLRAEERRAFLGLVSPDQLIHDASLRRELIRRIVSFSLEHVKLASWAMDLGIRPVSTDSFHDDWRSLVDGSWGPIGAARIERMMRVMRKAAISAVLGKEGLAMLLAATTREEREATVATLRERFAWRALFAAVRTPVVALGGMRRVQAAKIRGMDRVEDEWTRALVQVPLRENRFLSWFFRGQLEEPAYPLWAARDESRAGPVGSIAWVHRDVEELVTTWSKAGHGPTSVFDGIYLSNVPDYLPNAFALFAGALRLCKPHAPIVALRQHGAKDWISSLRNLRHASVENLRTLPQWRYEQTAAYVDGVIVRSSS